MSKLSVRVLHVIDSLGEGGAEYQLLGLLPALHGLGVEAEVLSLRGEGPVSAQLKARGVPVLTPASSLGKWDFLGARRNISELYRSGSFDVLHAHLFMSGIAAGLVGNAAVRTVSLHNLAYSKGCNPPGPGLWLRKTLNRLVLGQRYQKCVGVSSAVEQHYRRHLGLQRTTTIPNGIVAADFEQLPEQPGRPSPLVVLPGRLVREKGHLDYLRAFADPGLAAINASLLIVGSGPMADEISHCIGQLNLEDRVQVRPAVPQSELYRILCSANLVVVPSRFEGFGMTALEALALGRPLVATRVGGMPEVLGDDVRWCEPGDVPGLTSATLDVLRDPAPWESLAQQGRQRVLRQYDITSCARQWAELYAALVKESSNG